MNRSLAALRDLHELYTTASRAITTYSADNMSSLLALVDCTFNSVRAGDLSADLVPMALNSDRYDNLPPDSFSPADHEHSLYMRDTELVTALGFVSGTTYRHAHDFARMYHNHGELVTLGSRVVYSMNLGGLPPERYAVVGHNHLDRYHTKYVNRAYRISGSSYRDLAREGHSHGYKYYFNTEDDQVLDAVAFRYGTSTITAGDIATASHTHDDRYFTREAAEEVLLFTNDPVPTTGLLALNEYTVAVGDLEEDIQPGTTNFTRLGLPGYNATVTSDAFVDLGDATATAGSPTYITMDYLDLFVYPGSYVLIGVSSANHTIKGVFPASYNFETDTQGLGLQEMLYIAWTDDEFGVYMYDFNDITETPYIRVVILYEVAEEYLETSPGYVYPAGYGQLNPDDMVDMETTDRFRVMEGVFNLAVPPSSTIAVQATVQISVSEGE